MRAAVHQPMAALPLGNPDSVREWPTVMKLAHSATALEYRLASLPETRTAAVLLQELQRAMSIP